MTTTTWARAWMIRRKDGLVLGFTDHDAALNFEGIRFRPDHGMSARALVQGSGLSVDNSEAAGACRMTRSANVTFWPVAGTPQS